MKRAARQLLIPHAAQYSAPYAMYEPAFRAALLNVCGLDLAAHIDAARQRAAMPMPDEPDEEPGRVPAESADYCYTHMEGDVARVQVRGVLLKYGSSLVDGPAMVLLRRDIRTLVTDVRAACVCLEIDSPGGSVYGLDDLAREIKALAAVKPVVAFIEDLGASAAYYLASQAAYIYATPSAMVGAIGTYSVIEDWSEAYAANGVKVHVLRTGALKGAGTEGTEVTPDQLAAWQAEVDFYGGLFAASVAAGRGLTPEAVADLHTGQVWPAYQAKDLRLIDDVKSVDETLELLRGMVRAAGEQTIVYAGNSAAGLNARGSTSLSGVKDMDDKATESVTPVVAPATLAELKAAFPSAGADFRETCLEAGDTLAAATTRWAGTLATQLTAANARAEEAEKRALALQAQALTSTTAVTFAATSEPPSGEAAWEADWARDVKLRAEFGGNKAAYLAGCRATADGRVRFAVA